jgi:cellulose synthase/poly-beta-1,6-N-acetylglucosamine synthase-like glycosyltransferase
MVVVEQVFDVILGVIAALSAYMVVVVIVGFFLPSKKFKRHDKKYKYAIVIAARNEEKIIVPLLHSIQKQDYPSDLIKVFVVAHNCTDRTAELARAEGATVFEYDNQKERTRGFALRHGFKMIKETVEEGVYAFDGLMFTDADFVMEKNFFTELNYAFDNKNYDIFTTYLNSTNMDEGIISAYRGVRYFANNCTLQRPRAVLGLNARIGSPAIVGRNYVFHDGYNSTSIADDGESTAYYSARGYRITFVESAKFYTENPVMFKTYVHQQIRWARGCYVVFVKQFLSLIAGLFVPKDFSERGKKQAAEKPKERFPRKVLTGTLKRLSVFDTIIYLFPFGILNFLIGVAYPIFSIIYGLITRTSIAEPLNQVLMAYLVLYLTNFAQYVATLIREYKNVRCNGLIFAYIFIMPLFDIFSQYLYFFALVLPTRWKHVPAPRSVTREIEQVHELKNITELIGIKKPADSERTEA